MVSLVDLLLRRGVPIVFLSKGLLNKDRNPLNRAYKQDRNPLKGLTKRIGYPKMALKKR